jgi:hypothetical protein
MTIYTPCGMPIGYPRDYAFTLLARLYPTYSPTKILKIAQGMDKVPVFVSYSFALTMFLLHISPVSIFIGSLIVPEIIYWMQLKGRYIGALIQIGVMFSILGRLGLFTISLTVFGYYSSGLQGLAAFWGARLIGGFVIESFLESREIERIASLDRNRFTQLIFLGFKCGMYERYFIHAYQFCSNKIGVTTDISLTEKEIEKSNWQFVCADYFRENKSLFDVSGSRFS